MSLIRKAKSEDLLEISKLNLELFNFFYKLDPITNLEWPTSLDGQEYFKAKISSENVFMEVLETEEKNIIGYILGSIIKRPLYRIDAKYAELEYVYVQPRYRGEKLGSQLINNFISWCKENKVNYISLLVDPKNEDVIKFYKKLGFSDYDLVMQLKLEN